MQDRVTHSLVGALRAVPSLSTLDDTTLLAIVGDSVNLVWRAGAKVFEQGSPADGLYIVIAGSVRVLDASGNELGILQAGDFFGELSLLGGSLHGNDVEAVEDAELLVVTKERFDDLLASSPEVARSIRETAELRGASPRPPSRRAAGAPGRAT
jgi:CRP-like cAMP-binding protein